MRIGITNLYLVPTSVKVVKYTSPVIPFGYSGQEMSVHMICPRASFLWTRACGSFYFSHVTGGAGNFLLFYGGDIWMVVSQQRVIYFCSARVVERKMPVMNVISSLE